MTITKQTNNKKIYTNKDWTVSPDQFNQLLDIMNNPPEPRGALKRYYDELAEAKKNNQ